MSLPLPELALFLQHRNTGMLYVCVYLQKILVNKRTYNGSFANSSPILTMFGIRVHNDFVDRSHDFGCYGNYFGRTICVTIVTKMGILLH